MDGCQFRIATDARGFAIYCESPAAPGAHAYCDDHRAVCVEQGRHVSAGDVSFSMLEVHEKRAARIASGET